MLRVANAPVSYGVFGMDPGPGVVLPGPDEILDAVAAAGYEGIDLGPFGFFGEGAALREALGRRGLPLAGGWVEMRFSDPTGLAEDLVGLDRALDLFEAGADADPAWRPKPTFADAGSPARRANPGRGKDRPEIGLDGEGWRRLADGVMRAAERCRARGFEPTFHHHACTHVEAPHEVDRLLEMTDVGLCFDTGHLLLGGGDPVRDFARWGDRINHLHLKDVRLSILHGIIAEGAGMAAVWRRGTFCELGAGDLDVDGFFSALRASGYRGWLVIEQDRLPAPGEPVSEAAEAQARNLAFVRARGF